MSCLQGNIIILGWVELEKAGGRLTLDKQTVSCSKYSIRKAIDESG
ncbi:hypothetical protein PN462_22875 [Spirulina sp. CS-785/01]|nr:hypothetical protein [Spirulina sp. CS-785/01]MDB9315974.1 hypothetical protein [Spirulina sp. CS-785/01]